MAGQAHGIDGRAEAVTARQPQLAEQGQYQACDAIPANAAAAKVAGVAAAAATQQQRTQAAGRGADERRELRSGHQREQRATMGRWRPWSSRLILMGPTG